MKKTEANINLGLVIKKIREEAGITQMELAEKTRITNTTISTMENGWQRVHEYNLGIICEALNVSMISVQILALTQKDIRKLDVRAHAHLKELLS